MRYYLIFFLISHLNLAIAQNEAVVSSLHLSSLNNKVLLTWSINQGFTCNGVDILRSSNGVDFETIGSISGVCGSSSESTPYEFTDQSPVANKLNYYRLSMGGIGFSIVDSIQLVAFNNAGFQLRNNPINENSILYFKNDNSNQFELLIYSFNGLVVHSEKSIENHFSLGALKLDLGTYFFNLNSSQESIVGTFVVAD